MLLLLRTIPVLPTPRAWALRISLSLHSCDSHNCLTEKPVQRLRQALKGDSTVEDTLPCATMGSAYKVLS